MIFIDRNQLIIILDFFCHEVMLGIEVDGYTHNFEEIYIKDDIKEKKMIALLITILRFLDEDVINNTDNVLWEIERYIKNYEAN